MIKVFSKGDLRKTEIHPLDDGFEQAKEDFHTLTNNVFLSANIVAVGFSEDESITTAYAYDADTGDFDAGDFFVAIKVNNLSNEVYFKSYKKGNFLNVSVSDDLLPKRYIFATGVYSNNDNITLYCSDTDADSLDKYERVSIEDFCSITLVHGAGDILSSDYNHVFS
jgi:hypothetical protein